ncbi:DUF2889 domain-containing protein [Pseudomonas schmalbachii]|uniref:DUF2889 domain-containing protein n=1 Tax=Pseudomonas schmalbachii TaxID=2816993 RepID=A0ABS3TUQ8_9PSED|nr:DUF2889 domain-containing protein [Pseudomonas schmalbachii]MBO3277406.1 DUF2889 domain-containing protein [Pseudomonas schmalbachii]
MTDDLPNGPARTLLHDRHVHCRGYLRDDGLIDIEGSIVDVKPVPSQTLYKTVEAGEPFHLMRMLLTVDMDFVIQDVKAFTEAAPTPICGNIASAYEALRGLKIGPGFKKQVSQRVGGVHGCTHLTELLGPMATTLYQTTFELMRKLENEKAARDPDYQSTRNNWVIGTCHAYHPDSEVTRKLLALGAETNRKE